MMSLCGCCCRPACPYCGGTGVDPWPYAPYVWPRPRPVARPRPVVPWLIPAPPYPRYDRRSRGPVADRARAVR